MQTIGFRFKTALEEIYGKSSSKKCAEEFGEKHAQAIDRLKRSDTITAKITTIARKKGISLDWLETGEGDMLQDKSSAAKVIQDKEEGSNKKAEVSDSKEQTLLEFYRKASDDQKDKILLMVMQEVMSGATS